MSRPSDQDDHLILLSAQTPRVLEGMAAELLAFLDSPQGQGPRYTLANVAYTLQVGRDAMAERLALSAATLSEVREGLRRFLDGSAEGLIRGAVRRARADASDDDEDAELARIEAWTATRDLGRLAEAWAKGRAVDWARLHAGAARRVSLPSYPFDLQRCWITESRGRRAANPIVAPSAEDPGVRDDRPVIASEKRAAPMSVEPAPATPAQPPKIQLSVLGSAPAPVAAAAPTPTAEPQPVAAAPAAAAAVAAAPRISDVELLQQLSQSLADALFVDVGDLDPDQTFVDLGVDSLVGVDWIRALNTRYGIAVKVTKIYDYPTLRDFADFLMEEIARGGAEEGDPGLPADAPEPPAAAAAPPPLAAESAAVAGPAPEARPADPAAALLAEVADILGVTLPEAAADRDWTELGFGAAEAGRLSARLLERRGVRVTDVDLLHLPTPRELSRLVTALAARGPEVAAAPALEPPAPVAAAPQPAPASERALVVSNVGRVADVTLSPWRTAPLASGEIRVAVRASAVNYPDVMCVNGLYPTMPDYPFVPGFEVAGVVVEAAADVTAFAPGDEIVAMTGQPMGGHAPFVNLPAAQAARKPRNVSFEDACSLPVCFSTVYTAFELGRLAAGETVLVQTATGGCGLVAFQLARLRSAQVIATSSKPHKRRLLEDLGAVFVTDYREAFDVEVRRATGGRGVDVVLNMVAGPAIQRGLNSLAPSGRYVELAVHAQRTSKPLDLTRLVDNQSFHSLDMRRLGARSADGADAGRVMRLMVEMVEAGDIVPITTRVYPLAHIREALELVAAGEHVGKIVISHTATQIEDREAACLAAVRAQALRGPSRPAAPAPESAAASSPVRAASATSPEPVAIIGIAGQFPKARDMDAFWDNLAKGVDCVGAPPFARWGVELDAAGRPVDAGPEIYPHLGALEGADCFDPAFFNISPKEARLMDPQQRLFLQGCWTAVEEAGYAPSSLSGTRCGVFVGCAQTDYISQAREAPGVHALMGGSTAVLAARICYMLDLKGPCLAIDTACSSALVAISQACTSVATGDCDMALAGGVVVLPTATFSQTLTDAGMLSPDGRCHTFDRAANGFVPCEGVGVVLLKRLSDALRDNDRIQGVIAGWGVNHDGKTNGMTAPSVVSQTALQREVHHRFGIDPATITYVEAHGTGTNLGDPIEVEGLIEAFRGSGAPAGSCALGSVKSNIGHALCAAGVAGVLKVVLALKHGQIPPTIHYDSLNPEISLDGSPFYVNDRLTDWTAPIRRGVVNSFSYNGTNAHVVIEAAPAAAARQAATAPAEGHIAVLSARTDEQLRVYARALLQRVRGLIDETSDADSALQDLVFTLQVGRDPLAERLSLSVTSLEDLARKLEAFVSGAALPPGVRRANAPEARSAAGLAQVSRETRAANVAAALAARDSEAIVAAWLAGEAIDWRRLYEGGQPRRLALPTYPFERKRYWISDQPASAPAAPRQPTAAPAAPPVDVRFAQLLGRMAERRGVQGELAPN